jgi:hypothetical protein
MSTNKNHNMDMDLSGRIMSLEQRLKGLQGRTAAIETRLSCPGNENISCAGHADEDFVPAMKYSEISVDNLEGKPETVISSKKSSLPAASVGKQLPVRPIVDTTGLIAGATLVGAGLLLFSGNIDVIKNPLVAIGCGILLIANALKRLVL